MAKKKKSHKKKFRNAQAQSPAVVQKEKKMAGDSSKQPETMKKSANDPTTINSQFSYVKKEIFHTTWIIGSIVVVYLVIWYLYGHTSLGSTLNSLIKI